MSVYHEKGLTWIENLWRIQPSMAERLKAVEEQLALRKQIRRTVKKAEAGK